MAELIAYFSRADENYFSGTLRVVPVGNTEIAATMLQEMTGGDLFEIEPLLSHSKDYNECIAQAKDDQRRNARPELTEYPDSLDQYDTIYLGYPNYWGPCPCLCLLSSSILTLTVKLFTPSAPTKEAVWGTARATSAVCAPEPKWKRVCRSTAEV